MQPHNNLHISEKIFIHIQSPLRSREVAHGLAVGLIDPARFHREVGAESSGKSRPILLRRRHEFIERVQFARDVVDDVLREAEDGFIFKGNHDKRVIGGRGGHDRIRQ